MFQVQMITQIYGFDVMIASELRNINTGQYCEEHHIINFQEYFMVSGIVKTMHFSAFRYQLLKISTLQYGKPIIQRHIVS